MKNLIALFIISLSTGCAHLNSSWVNKSDHLRYVVEVDALADGRADTLGKRVFVASVNKEDQLTKNYYEKYLKAALQAKGYSVASAPADCDLMIMVGYGIGWENVVKSKPIIGYMPGQTTTYRGNTSYYGARSGYLGNSSTQMTASTSGSFYRAGTKQWIEKEYTRIINIEAFINAEVKKSKGDANNLSPTWKLTLVSSGYSNDLRRAYPRMLSAGLKYFNEDTNGKVTEIVTKVNDAVETIFNAPADIRAPSSQKKD